MLNKNVNKTVTSNVKTKAVSGFILSLIQNGRKVLKNILCSF